MELAEWRTKFDEFWRRHPRWLLAVTAVLMVAVTLCLLRVKHEHVVLYQGF